MVTVSVIVPLFNKEKYIIKCINSILCQTYPDFELFIVNDGSTDSSVQKISTYPDPRIKVINQNNKGPGAARNKGLEAASGKYVTFLDADDEWAPEFLKIAVTTLEAHPECDVFLCGSTWEPQRWTRLPVLPREDSPVSGPWNFPFHTTGEEASAIMDFFALGTVVLRRSVPTSYGGFFDKVFCTSGEDAYLWIQVMINHTLYRELTSLVTINTEGSDLGIGRGELKPVPPSLVYTEHIVQNTPAQHRESLSKLLNYVAFFALRRSLHQFKLITALRLYRKFPGLVMYKPDDFPSFPKAFWIIPWRKIKKRIFGA